MLKTINKELCEFIYNIGKRLMKLRLENFMIFTKIIKNLEINKKTCNR